MNEPCENWSIERTSTKAQKLARVGEIRRLERGQWGWMTGSEVGRVQEMRLGWEKTQDQMGWQVKREDIYLVKPKWLEQLQCSHGGRRQAQWGEERMGGAELKRNIHKCLGKPNFRKKEENKKFTTEEWRDEILSKI